MRRALSALIMGVSLLVASAAWAGFILSHTVLDPGRSERLADHLLEDPAVRDVIINRLADSIEATIPTEVPVGRDSVEQAATIAVDDPRVEALIREGIVRSHQNALNGVDEPVVLDASALGAAGRDAVVGLNPELDSVLPAAPPLPVELPSTGLSWLGDLKKQIDRFTRLGAVVSLIGIASGFVLSRNRPKTLRRVSYWAFGASAFWLAAGYAIPWLLERIAPSTVSIASAAVDVFFGAMITPALTMAGIGVALLAASLIWPTIARRRPAAMLDRATGAPRHQPNQAVRPVANGWQPESSGGGPRPATPYGAVASGTTPFGATPIGGNPAGGNRPAPPYSPAPAAPGPTPTPDRTTAFPVIRSRFDEPGIAPPDHWVPDPDVPAPSPAGATAPRQPASFAEPGPYGADPNRTVQADPGGFAPSDEDRRTSRMPGSGPEPRPDPGPTAAAPGGEGGPRGGGPRGGWQEGVGYAEPDTSEDETLNAPWPPGRRA